MSYSKRGISVILIVLLILSTLPMSSFMATNDYTGHWAQSQIETFMEAEIITEDAQGRFRPDDPITRAEFVAIINNALGYQAKAETNFPDVSSEAWYYDHLLIAKEAGYIAGYPNGNFGPDDPITRQEAAVIYSEILKLEEEGELGFVDAQDVPEWSRAYVRNVEAKRFMVGYPDGTFRALDNISRCEAVVLTNSVVGTMYRVAGTYGSDELQVVEGNVTITAPDVTLRNMHITGNLIFAAGIGDGDATLDGVTVDGDTYVNGGGENSIIITNSLLKKIVIYKRGNSVRIVAKGSTAIEGTKIASGVKIQEEGLIGDGFKGVEVDSLGEGESLVLEGDFDDVIVMGTVEIEITGDTSVTNLVVDAAAEGTTIDTEGTTSIENITLNTATTVTGEGTIVTAEVNANDVVIEQEVEEVVVGEGVTEVTIANETVVESTVFTLTPVIKTTSGGTVTPTVAAVSATPSAGSVEAGTLIALSTSTADATIYYTTDGTTPSTNSKVYSMPIEIKSDLTIKAMAVRSGYRNSSVGTFSYTVGTLLGFTYSYETTQDGIAPDAGAVQVESIVLEGTATADGSVSLAIQDGTIDLTQTINVTIDQTAAEVAAAMAGALESNPEFIGWTATSDSASILLTRDGEPQEDINVILSFTDSGTSLTASLGEGTLGRPVVVGQPQMVTLSISGDAVRPGLVETTATVGGSTDAVQTGISDVTTSSSFANSLANLSLNNWTVTASQSQVIFTNQTEEATKAFSVTMEIIAMSPDQGLVDAVHSAAAYVHEGGSLGINAVPEGYKARFKNGIGIGSEYVPAGAVSIGVPAGLPEGVYDFYLHDVRDTGYTYLTAGTYQVFVDNTAPEVFVTDGDGSNSEVLTGGMLSTRTSFYLDLVDDSPIAATLQLNGGSAVSIANGDALTNDGVYHLVVTDAAGNVTALDFTIDTTPPSGYEAAFDAEYISLANRANASFTIAGGEVGAEYAYAIDDLNDATEAVTGTGILSEAISTLDALNLSSLSDGMLTLSVVLTDQAGLSGEPIMDNIEKDTLILPPLAMINGGEEFTNERTANIEFTPSPDYVQTMISLDQAFTGAAWQTFATSATYELPDVDADYMVWVKTRDTAGNESVAISMPITLDRVIQPPVISAAPETLTNGDVIVSIIGDPDCTFAYSLDGGDVVPYGASFAVTDNGTTVTAYAQDEAGNTAQSELLIDWIDKVKPTAAVTIEEGKPAVNHTLVQVQMTSDSDTSHMMLSENADFTEAVWITYNGQTTFTLAEGDGLHTVYGKTRDAAGNESDPVSDAVFLDTQVDAPIITAEPSELTNIDVVITITASEEGEISYSLDGGETSILYSGPFNLSENKSVSAQFEDLAGNISNDTLSVTWIDKEAPSGYAVSFDQGFVNGGNETNSSFTFSGAEVGATYDYTITSDGGGATASGNGTIASVSQQITGIDVSALADGTLSLSVTLTDLVGNTSGAVSDTVEKDTVAPSGYSVSSDQNYANLSNENAISFSFEGAEVGATYYFVVSDNEGVFASGGTGTIETATDQVIDVDVSGLADGTLTLHVELEDPAGNGGIEVTDTLEKDTVKPSGYAVSFDQQVGNLLNQVAISFTFSSAEVGTAYNYTITSDGGGNNVTGSGTVSTSTDEITNIDVSGLQDGTLVLTVALTDFAGNTGSVVVDNVTKDTVAPAGYNVSFSETYVNAAISEISFNYVDAEEGATYSFTVSDGNALHDYSDVGIFVASTGSHLNIPVADFDDGDLTLTLIATDVNGNSGEAVTAVITKDSLIPSITARSPQNGSVGVSLTSDIVVTYNEPISLADASGIELWDGTGAAAINVSVSGNDLTIDPVNSMTGNTVYTVTIAMATIKDLYGNAAVSEDFSFTSGDLSNVVWNLEDTTVYVGETLTVDLTGATDNSGNVMDGNVTVTVTSDNVSEGEGGVLYNGAPLFTDGSASVNVILSEMGTQVLTVEVNGVTPTPAQTVTVNERVATLGMNVFFGSIGIDLMPQNSTGSDVTFEELLGMLDLNDSMITITKSDAPDDTPLGITFQQLGETLDISVVDNTITFNGEPGLYGNQSGIFESGILSEFEPFEHDTVTVTLAGMDGWTITQSEAIPYFDIVPAMDAGYSLGFQYWDPARTMDVQALEVPQAVNIIGAQENWVSVAGVNNTYNLEALFIPFGNLENLTSLTLMADDVNDALMVNGLRTSGTDVFGVGTILIRDGSTGSINYINLMLEGTGEGEGLMIETAVLVAGIEEMPGNQLDIGFDRDLMPASVELSLFEYISQGATAVTGLFHSEDLVTLTLSSAPVDGDVLNINIYDDSIDNYGLKDVTDTGEVMSCSFVRSEGQWIENAMQPPQEAYVVFIDDTTEQPVESYDLGDIVVFLLTDDTKTEAPVVTVYTETGDPTGVEVQTYEDEQLPGVYIGTLVVVGLESAMPVGTELVASTTGDVLHVFDGEVNLDATITINGVVQGGVPETLEMAITYDSINFDLTVEDGAGSSMALNTLVDLDEAFSGITFSDSNAILGDVSITFSEILTFGEQETPLAVYDLANNRIELLGTYEPDFAEGIFTTEPLSALQDGEYDTVTMTIQGFGAAWSITDTQPLPQLSVTNLVPNATNTYMLDFDLTASHIGTFAGDLYSSKAVTGQSFDLGSTPEDMETNYDNAYMTASANGVAIADIVSGDGAIIAFYLAPNDLQNGQSMANVDSLSITRTDSDSFTLSATKTDPAQIVNATMSFHILDLSTNAEAILNLSLSSDAGATDVTLEDMSMEPSGDLADTLVLNPTGSTYTGAENSIEIQLSLENGNGPIANPNYVTVGVVDDVQSMNSDYYDVTDNGLLTINNLYLSKFGTDITTDVTLTITIYNETTVEPNVQATYGITYQPDGEAPGVGSPAVVAADNNDNGTYDTGDTITLNFSEPIQYANITSIDDLVLSIGSWGATTLSHVTNDLESGLVTYLTVNLQNDINTADSETITIAAAKVEDAASNPAEADLVFTLPDISQTLDPAPTPGTSTAVSVDNPIVITYDPVDNAYLSAVTVIKVLTDTGTYIEDLPSEDWATTETGLTVTPSETNQLSVVGDYKLKIVATGYADATTDVIQMTQGVLAGMAFAAEGTPAGPDSGQTLLANQPVIELVDQFGNIVTGLTGTPVTVAKTAGDANDALWQLYGTLTVASDTGIVTFTDLEALATEATTGSLTFSNQNADSLTASISLPAPSGAPELPGGFSVADYPGYVDGLVVNPGTLSTGTQFAYHVSTEPMSIPAGYVVSENDGWVLGIENGYIDNRTFLEGYYPGVAEVDDQQRVIAYSQGYKLGDITGTIDGITVGDPAGCNIIVRNEASEIVMTDQVQVNDSNNYRINGLESGTSYFLEFALDLYLDLDTHYVGSMSYSSDVATLNPHLYLGTDVFQIINGNVGLNEAGLRVVVADYNLTAEDIEDDWVAETNASGDFTLYNLPKSNPTGDSQFTLTIFRYDDEVWKEWLAVPTSTEPNGVVYTIYETYNEIVYHVVDEVWNIFKDFDLLPAGQ